MKTKAEKKHDRRGFILVMLLVIITVFGSYMAVLAGISNQLVVETNIAYLRACQKNMTKSAIAFSTINQDSPAGEAIELNTAALGKSCKSLTVTKKTEPEPALQITGQCQLAGQKLDIKETIKIINKSASTDNTIQ